MHAHAQARDDQINRYLAALDLQLNGPRRAKSEIIREIGDGLADAAGGYAAAGMSPAAAAEAAVAEFGDPGAIATEFQNELTVYQARHALAFLAVLGPVSEVSSRIVWSNGPQLATRPAEFTLVIAKVVDVLSWGTSIVAALLLVALGLGSRWISFPQRFTRFVGYGILAIIVKMVVSDLVLTVLFGATSVDGRQLALEGLQSLGYAVLWGYAAWLSWRCLSVARHSSRLVSRAF